MITKKSNQAGIAEAECIGAYLGNELSILGFNMNFAPVADVITVENNDDIGYRSFGTNPELVAKMVAAEVKFIQQQNICATLKHFPGNGSIEANTHQEKGICSRSLEDMRQCEFVPFKAGIDAGVDLVMMSHMSAVNLAGEEIPATFSSIIVNKYLREELGFNKVVISDALNMKAITDYFSPAEAAINAINAGVDILLMSPNVNNAVQGVIEAVNNGMISENRIDESVSRIITLKIERGILK